ncbi:hypothetical protein O6V14_00950 [Sphingomonas faeni]
MPKFVGRIDRRAGEDEMFDQMGEPAFARAAFLDEATLVPH